MPKDIEYTVYDEDGDSYEVTLPGKWRICDDCEGDGRTSAHMGSWTASEWAQEDPDFQEDYMAGRYDRACPHCKGTGKVHCIDWSALKNQDPKLHDQIVAQEREQAAWEREAYYERLMGA